MKKRGIDRFILYLAAVGVSVLSVIQSQENLLLLLNLALSGVVLLTIAEGTAKAYSGIMAISIAAYTFYKIPDHHPEYRSSRRTGVYADSADDHAGILSGNR